MTDIRQNRRYADYLQGQGWVVEEHGGVFYYIKKILFFSVMKVQRPEILSYEVIKRLSKKYKAVQIVVEPRDKKQVARIKSLGFKLTSPFIPSKTVMLKLNKSEKAVFNSFSKSTRYSVRKSARVSLYKEKNLDKFRRAWKSAVDFKRQVLSVKQMQGLRNSFGRDSLFLLANDKEAGLPRRSPPTSRYKRDYGEAKAGGIFLVAGSTGYYWYGFANHEGRRTLAQYKVVWEGIKWAKARGAKHFDMEGIYDERFPLNAWHGFTKFKKGFGGRVVEHPGAYQKIIFPL